MKKQWREYVVAEQETRRAFDLLEMARLKHIEANKAMEEVRELHEAACQSLTIVQTLRYFDKVWLEKFLVSHPPAGLGDLHISEQVKRLLNVKENHKR